MFMLPQSQQNSRLPVHVVNLKNHTWCSHMLETYVQRIALVRSVIRVEISI